MFVVSGKGKKRRLGGPDGRSLWARARARLVGRGILRKGWYAKGVRAQRARRFMGVVRRAIYRNNRLGFQAYRNREVYGRFGVRRRR